MFRRKAILATLCTFLFVLALAVAAPAGAEVTDPAGNEWRQLYETTGLTWDQVASICPQDGVTPCSGSFGPSRDLTGWTWATSDQVVAFMGNYEPAILAASPPSVAGPQYFFSASGFLGVIRWTQYIALTYFSSEWTAGWTASTQGGVPVESRVGAGFPPISGGFSVAPAASGDATSDRGVWLWRPGGVDHSAPVVTANVSGTAGTNGWYTSEVSVSWDTSDAESPITSTSGCDPAAVTADTAGTTFTCSATSVGGTGSASTTVMRDATPPTLICGATPTFELTQIGVSVPSTVVDATSGPTVPTTAGPALTSTAGTFNSTVTATDHAGNRSTALCPYRVVVPTCHGLTPTRIGTGLNDTINGTAGRDVIVGLAGSDTINGLGGDDVICGGDGLDTVDGGDGADWIEGGASNDDLSGGSGNDFLDGGAGSDSLRGGNGTDTCVSGEARLSSCEL